jgi:hypothetical protein
MKMNRGFTHCPHFYTASDECSKKAASKRKRMKNKKQQKKRTGAMHLQPNRETRKATAAAAAADHQV